MKIVRKSVLALLLAASVPMTGQAAGIVSAVATASDDIVVSSNAEATVTATGRTDLIAGNYPALFQVGTWSASVTAGALAFKFNSGIMSNISASGLAGSATNSGDSTKKVQLIVNPSVTMGECNSTQQTISGVVWRACPQGVSSLTSSFALVSATALTPGSYPVGIDVAAYAE
ncbi:hypothetical protein [Serratia ureilytica]|uniref:hypothetical protein n=1 Tax=Serratia ureilytica TaxID=300181 RepID=UPI0034C68885